MRSLPSRNERSVPSQQDFARLESAFGRPLPDSYKEFLTANNNVWLTEGSEEAVLPEQPSIFVNQFYDAIAQGETMPELVTVNVDYGARLPAETITIGSDVYGNQILLVVEGDDTGMVLLWDHDEEGFEEPPSDPYHNVYELAPDLETFVDCFRNETQS